VTTLNCVELQPVGKIVFYQINHKSAGKMCESGSPNGQASFFSERKGQLVALPQHNLTLEPADEWILPTRGRMTAGVWRRLRKLPHLAQCPRMRSDGCKRACCHPACFVPGPAANRCGSTVIGVAVLSTLVTHTGRSWCVFFDVLYRVDVARRNTRTPYLQHAN
jgi:hypothetical protein